VRSDVSTRPPRLGRLTPPGKASFEFAVAFAALALVFPVSSLVGVGFALHARKQGYPRWAAALIVALWCGFLGVLLRGMLKMGVVP
jgi:hypothetical protein